jgi:hypothetical protein
MTDMRYLIDLVESADRGLSDSAYIQSVVKRDQNERHEYSEFARRFDDWEQAASAYAAQKGRPRDDVFGERAEQERFINRAKKFQFENFSRQDWNDFWLISQHCDWNIPFQKWALQQIEQNLGQDNTEYRYLYDRISKATNGTQRYGTQNVNPPSTKTR